ncbi:MAG TPA: Flp pilus assembly protein CpaB [Bryobacteraceae bacterium]|jgi:pilus assembly protein CpaB
MYRRLVFVLIFAVIVAGLSSVVLYQAVVASVQSQPKTSGHKLLVAARDLGTGELIRQTDIREISWNGDPPATAVVQVNAVVGRGAIAPIYAGEPILEGRLAPSGAGAGLASTIPVGKRAVALRVNEVVGLAGFVMPGMRVDVLVAGNAPGSTNPTTGTLSRTILQNIEVLSAGQNIEKSVNGKPEVAQVVNLLVTPEQAESLSLAGSETKVQLVLRNPLDTEEETTPGTSVAKLFGQPEAEAAPRPKAAPHPRPAAPKPATITAPVTVSEPPVEIFAGSKRTVTTNGEGR